MRTVEVKWTKDLRFKAVTPDNAELIMDSSQDAEIMQTAVKPMEMLLIAVAGCTGMDTISILKKMKENVKDFTLSVFGERREEEPKIYTKIEIIYKFRGVNLSDDKIKRAIELSQNKYCSVSAMLKTSAEVTYRYEIENI